MILTHEILEDGGAGDVLLPENSVCAFTVYLCEMFSACS